MSFCFDWSGMEWIGVLAYFRAASLTCCISDDEIESVMSSFKSFSGSQADEDRLD